MPKYSRVILGIMVVEETHHHNSHFWNNEITILSTGNLRSVNVTATTPYKDRRNGLWNKCAACENFVFKRILERNFFVCPHCNHYSPMPADMRLHYLFDPDSLNEGLSSAIEVADPVRLDTLTNQDQRLIAAGEGTISSFPAILAIADPYAVSQYSHFVTLLAAIRTALQRKSPLITIYPSDAIPKRKSDNPGKAELSSAEITYLTIETDSLSQACLPQITILTDSDPTAGFSTKFPLGDLVLAEQSSACPNRVSERTESLSKVTLQKTPLSSHTQPDVMIDRQVQRQDLPATLGKLLAFFAK